MLVAFELEPVLRILLFRHTRNTADVEELLQDTYARLLCVKGPPANARAYVLTIAKHLAFDWLRHKQVVPIELLADVDALEVLDESALRLNIAEDTVEQHMVRAARNLALILGSRLP